MISQLFVLFAMSCENILLEVCVRHLPKRLTTPLRTISDSLSSDG